MDLFLREIALNDVVMESLINRLPKYSKRESESPFNDLIRSIISQQLSIKAANTIYNRFIDLIGNTFSADDLYEINIEKLKSVGISRPKCTYIKSVAEKVVENQNYFLKLESNSDEDVITELTTIKGVGVWTAQMFLIFTLGRLNVLPLGDVAIQNSVQKFYKLASKPNDAELEKIAENWQPYRTIGCLYLWNALDAKLEL
jgi:DNA-3-methyladenine glycosylase II